MSTDSTVRKLELLGAASWPALERDEIDGWLCRFSGALGNRANSVLPRDRGHLPLSEKIAQAEAYYSRRDAEVLFQISPAAQPAELRSELAGRNYESVNDVKVMTKDDLRDLSTRCSSRTATLFDSPNTEWMQNLTRIDGMSGIDSRIFQRIISSVTLSQAFASVASSDGPCVAVGRAVVQDGWIGFFNLATAKESRRQGYGRSVMSALARWGVSAGATRAYLQVDAENEPAIQLYASLGFTQLYQIDFVRPGPRSGPRG